MSDRTRPPVPGWLLSLVLCSLALSSAARAAGVEVEIRGIAGPPADNVRAFLGIAQREFPDDEAIDAEVVRRLHRRAPEQIRRALEPFGYYHARVDSSLERTETGWRAVYEVQPGEPVRLTAVTIRIEGAAKDDPAFESLLAELPLEEGRQLNHGDYETAKRRMLELAAERGYIEARWLESTLLVDPDRRQASAALVLDSGPRYRFGEIRFERTVVGESLLRRYLRFEPGEPFLASRLLELQYALDDSGYFRRVEVSARRDLAADGRIPIEIGLEARPKHLYTFGIGFGTDTGARASVGRDTRYVNRRGHRLESRVRVAQIGTSLAARYTIPLAQPWRERLELDTSLDDKEVGDLRSRQFTLGASRVTVDGGWQRSLSIAYERSRDENDDEVTTRNLVMPGIELVRSRYDDAIYASRGYRVSFGVRGGAETLGSDVSFLRMRASATLVRRLWAGGRVITRAELGRVRVDAFDDLPLSQRFFAGGDQSVRGFRFQSLGPQDADGDVIGGTYLAVGSIELEQLIAGNWGAAVFVDAGNAANESDFDLRTAAGIGLRYRSPVGVFRVDVAKATDGDESARLHLSLGVDL